MSQEDFNMQQSENDQNSLEKNGGQPGKKQSTASMIASTAISVIVWRLFGFVGGLICFGGFLAVYAIAKSRLPIAARIILCILTAIGFVVLLFGAILAYTMILN